MRSRYPGPRNPPGVTRQAVDRLFKEGWGVAAIARELGVGKSTVCYHARALGIHAERKFARRYDWKAVQAYLEAGHTVTEACQEFGCSRQAFHEAKRRGLLVTQPRSAPIEVYLVAGRRTSRHHLKGRLLSAGLKEARCEECGVAEWRGRPLFLSLHHINGDGTDNRLENLAILCPNCHAQTPNFGSLNRRRAA